MRTKHLLTAIALPMLFAACTADELGTMDNTVKDDLSKRPIVEGVKIAFNDANTRALQGDKFNTIKFEEGDKVGALLVDQLAAAAEVDPIKRYNILVNSFNTNYVFETKDGVDFSAESYLTEGNYVFYWPFNGQRLRDQILTDLPTAQKLTKGADGVYTSFPDVLSYSEKNGAPLAIGYDFISSTDADKTVQSTMKQIYAVPLITVKNGYTETPAGSAQAVAKAIKIKQIVLTKTGGFTVKAPLKFASANQTAYAEATNTTPGAQYSNKQSIVSALFNEAIPETPADVKQGFWLDKTVKTSKATSDILGSALPVDGTANEIVLTLDTPVEVAAEGSFSFYAVIPAEDYATQNLEVKIINEQGLTSDTKIQLNDAVLQPSKRYPVGEYEENGVDLSAAKGEALTGTVIDFDNTGVLVESESELISAVKNAAVGTLELRLGGTAVINQSVAAYLKSTSTQATAINIVNEAAIEGTFTFEPVKTVTFKEGVVIADGANVVFKSANIAIDADKNLKVAKGATLTYTSSAGVNSVTVINEGTLKLTGDIDVKAINNAGTVSVEEDVTVTTVAVTGNFNNGNAAKAAALLNIASGKTLTLAVGKLVNNENATINNQGTLAADGFLENKAKAVINNGGEDNFSATITSGTGTTSAGTINNWGNATIEKNTGNIEMKSVNAKLVVVTGTGGSINNDELATVNGGTGSTVTYTMTGTHNAIPEINNATGVTDIVLDGVQMIMKSSVAAAVNYNIVVKGKTTFSSNIGSGADYKFALADGKTWTVKAGAEMTVNSGVIIGRVDAALNIVIEEGGSVGNYGKIYASNAAEDFGGNGSVTNAAITLP